MAKKRRGRPLKINRKPLAHWEPKPVGLIHRPDIFLVERLVNERLFNGQMEYQVKWKGYPHKFNSWEPEENIFSTNLIVEFERRRQRVNMMIPGESGESTSAANVAGPSTSGIASFNNSSVPPRKRRYPFFFDDNNNANISETQN